MIFYSYIYVLEKELSMSACRMNLELVVGLRERYSSERKIAIL
jgi:hypothetical protein